MIHFSVEHADKKKILSVKGSITIEHVGELREILLDMKKQSDNVVLNLSSVSAVDASCLQLLCSAHRTYQRENKTLDISNNCSKAFQQAVRDAGYAQHKGCRHDADDICLWIRWAER